MLALLVAVFDLIPLVGATIGAHRRGRRRLHAGRHRGVVMLIFSLVYQQVENQIIQPIVMKRSVSVSPFIVLTSVLIGSSLLGIIGALLAIPFAGSIQIALREVLEARRSQVQGARERLASTGRGPPIEVDIALEPGLPPPDHASDPPPPR